MRWLIALTLLATSTLPAQDWSLGDFSPEANPVQRITQALLSSGVDEFTPKIYEDGGRRFSYRLTSVRSLGRITHGPETFSVATAFFVRSSAEGREQPTPRGHGFLLLLDRHDKIVSHCRLDFPDEVELLGDKLYRVPSEGEKKLIADLDPAAPSSRRRGFLIDNNNTLDYPYSDTIPGITPEQAMAKAEAWLKTSGLLKPVGKVSGGPPTNQILNGNISPKAWGYRRDEAYGWEILFLVQTTPIPKIKGTETAYAIRVMVTEHPEKIEQAHGAATAYDHKPFAGYTPRNANDLH